MNSYKGIVEPKTILFYFFMGIVFFSQIQYTPVKAASNAEIYYVSYPSGSYNIGNTVSTRVYIRNTGTTTRSFWIGNSYQGPNSEWYHVPAKQTAVISPSGTASVLLYWKIQKARVFYDLY